MSVRFTIKPRERVFVLTGAGIGAESGIRPHICWFGEVLPGLFDPGDHRS